MNKMVDRISEALVELKTHGACRFHKGYVGPEWKTHYAPKLREAFPDVTFSLDGNNHIHVKTESRGA